MTKQRPRVLTNVEYNDAIEHFEASFASVWQSYSEADKLSLKRWIEKMHLITPAYSLRADALSAITEYPSELVRDFLFDLCFVFFTSWGVDHGAERLAASLSQGLQIDGPNIDLSMIEDAVLQSMSLVSTGAIQRQIPAPAWKRWLGLYRPPTLVEILASNKPLLMIYLMYLGGTYAALARADAPETGAPVTTDA